MCALALCAAGAFAGDTPPPPATDALELLQQLQKAPIDPSQVYFVRNVRLARNGINIYLNRGFIGLLAPVAGKVTGAAFTGDAEVLLQPPNPVEKRSLAQFTKSAVLEERFSAAHFRFTDGTAAELLEKARKADPDDPEQPTGLVEGWGEASLAMNAQTSARILQDLLGESDRPFFHARLEGATLGEFEVTDDERVPEAIRVGGVREKEGIVYADIWCAYPSRKSRERTDALQKGTVRVTSYKIETRIREDNSLEGRAELELELLSGADRVIAFELSQQLRLRRVQDEEGRELPVLPDPSAKESSEGERNVDWITVVLNAPTPAGSKFRLTFNYDGNVITDVGNDVLYVGARGGWYPNRGPSDHAAYDLTFHYPDRLTLVATGKRVESGSADGWKHSRWVSDGTFRVAGFNLGVYDSRVRKVGRVAVEVYATREAEAALEKRHLDAATPLVVETSPMAEGRASLRVIPGPPPRPLDPAALLDQVATRAADAIRYFEGLFGPFPYSRLALAQIPGNFGQGWPELVYLPTLTFLSGDERLELRRRSPAEDFGPGLFVNHEIAHQWWGNEVGWKSYHDQWLSEGFASYAAALALAREKDGDRKMRELLHLYKQELLSKNNEGETIESGGPIWLGRRLTSSLNPQGYDNIVYKKSCWVLHMLRDLMTDPKTGSDERFFKMLRGFVEAYRGGSPSTEDFLEHANRYMTPAMDLDRNHRLDWFFTDWVYGTGIPSYKLDVKTRRLASNRYVVQGTIQQSGVPDTFETLVPVVATVGRERKILLGRVLVGSAGGSFRFTTTLKPARVAIDDTNLLAVVR